MPQFTLRFANRSHSIQDWDVYQQNSFQLQPDHVQPINITINNDHTYQIAVSTNGGYTYVALSYHSHTQNWTIQTPTPNEWQLAQGNGIVTLRCFLEDVRENVEQISYKVLEIEKI